MCTLSQRYTAFYVHRWRLVTIDVLTTPALFMRFDRKQVSVGNLPVATQGMPDLFRVVFHAGAAVARTPSKRANPDGSVEWTRPLGLVVYDTNAKLVAVVQQFNIYRGWIIGPGCYFDGTSIMALPNKWVNSPNPPTAPKFYAELKVDVEEGEPPGNQHTALGSMMGEPDEDYRGLPMLCSPRVIYNAGSYDSNDGKFKGISPSSVTTTSSTLMTTSVGGGFFGDGTRIEVYSEDGSPDSSALSELPRPTPVNLTTAPPSYDEGVREPGTLETAARAVGAVVPLHPELAVSRSFSWSPLASSVAHSVGASAKKHQRGAAKPGSKVSPSPREKFSQLFSWSSLASPAALPEAAAASQQQKITNEAAVGTATPSLHPTSPRVFLRLPPVSPLAAPDDLPAAQTNSCQDTTTTIPTPENGMDEWHKPVSNVKNIIIGSTCI